MNQKNLLIAGVVVTVAVFVLAYSAMQQGQNTPQNTQPQQQTNQNEVMEEEATEEQDAMMEENNNQMMEEEAMESREDKMMQDETMEDDAMMEEEESMMEDVATMAMDSEGSKSVSLQDVSGGDSSGNAYIYRGDQTLYHAVDATLPEPQAGTQYEGWLVNPNTNEFISTGVMELNNNGNYMLEFSESNLYPSYNKVVITLEQNIDSTPEEHVLEGTFSN